jgi:cytochrome P450
MSVQGCPVVHFDHHSRDYAADPAGLFRHLLAEAPVAWTDAYGGFWVVSRYEDVVRIVRDDLTFSSRKDLSGPSGQYQGVSIPARPSKSYPIELDPPKLGKHRQLVLPRFSPAQAKRAEPRLRAYATWCIDRCVESGRIDFIGDLATPVTSMATLRLLGLPIENWKWMAPPFHNMVACLPGTPGLAEAYAGCDRAVEFAEVEMEKRIGYPCGDVLSDLANAEIDGAPLPRDEALATIRLILGGGQDTTTALIGHALNYLGDHPEQRQRLGGDPQLMKLFCEEMLRVAAPTQALARTATRDVELGGQQIKAGERVMVVWAAANRDPGVFDNPDQVIIDRKPNLHTSFGIGAHRCTGSNLARMEFITVVGEVLRRLPEYRLLPGAEPYQTIGAINGWHLLPAEFTPGKPVGPKLVADVEAEFDST